MKTSFQFLVLFLFVTFYACNNAPKSSVEEVSAATKSTVSPTFQDTISQATFTQWTQLWDSLGSNYSDTSLVKFYKLPIIDMSEFLTLNAKTALFYQGLESLGAGKYEAHLVLTGLDSRGNNIGKYFDVTQPCPRFCGPFN